jgi:DNA-binding PadR family transcriptional regulator
MDDINRENPGSREGSPIAAENSGSESLITRIDKLRHAFVLEALVTEPEGKTAGDLNKGIGKAAQRELGLSPDVANRARADLVSQGYLRTTKRGRTTLYLLTESGRDYLSGLERPTLNNRSQRSASIDESAITDEVRAGQIGYLLLQLMEAKDWRLSKSEANKFKNAPRASLGLRPAIANYRRAKLAEQGLIEISTVGRSEEYRLTTDGRDYLAAGAPLYESAVFKLKGGTLNALIGAARELAFENKQFAAPAQKRPNESELTQAVLEEFRSLLRERHSRSGLVPIHEVRHGIAARFGAGAARHDVLDEIILALWRNGHVGLEAISDLAGTSEEQLNDSIPGVSGTLFYLEAAREPAVAP